MASPGFLSKRVRKKSQTGLTTDRYEFLGLDQAEPDLGDPLVGLSSVGANPAPIGGSKYVLVAAGGNTGKRYWVDTSTLSSTGLIPGSFTVFNNNIQVGAANSFNKFNFVGSGVTVDSVSSDPNLQTGIATVRITVTDLVGPGNVNSIPYKASSGFLAGASDFVYSSGSIGIGTTVPTATLEVVGSLKVSGTITGTATTATTALGFSTTSSINTSGIITSTGGFVGGLTGTATTATTALGFSTTASINTSGIITATGGFVGGLTGTATTAITATNLANASGITTGTIARARLTGTYDINITGSIANTGQILDNLTVTGFSTFTSGPVVIGSGIQTGTSKLQVTGDTFITGSVGIGTTNPVGQLHVSAGPVIIGPTTPTGTANQNLQISGSAYIAGDSNSVGLSIGSTNNTTYPVDIRLNGSTTAGMIRLAPTTTTRPAGIVYSNSGSSNMWTGVLNSSGAGQNLSGFPAYAAVVGLTAGTTPLLLVTNALERVRLFDTGEVGIGTTNLTGTTNQRLQVSGGAYVSGDLGIGTTNPRTPLQVETYGVKTGVGTFTASVGISTTLDSFSVSSTDFKIAEYTVHIGFGSSIQAQKVLVTQDQSTAYSQEYGVVYNNTLLVSIGATISGGNCILQATPQTGVSGLTTYRFARNTLL
jgi:hypothetical protein